MAQVEFRAQLVLFGGVIPSKAVLQAEREISRGVTAACARCLEPLVKAQASGMAPQKVELEVSHCQPRSRLDPNPHPLYCCSVP